MNLILPESRCKGWVKETVITSRSILVSQTLHLKIVSSMAALLLQHCPLNPGEVPLLQPNDSHKLIKLSKLSRTKAATSLTIPTAKWTAITLLRLILHQNTNVPFQRTASSIQCRRKLNLRKVEICLATTMRHLTRIIV